MPYFIRARTYLRYAEEEYRRGHFREAFVLAGKAIWALSQVEAPREKPEPPHLWEALKQAAEPEVVDFFRRGWERLEQAGEEEARQLAAQALKKAREILSPILGPSLR